MTELDKKVNKLPMYITIDNTNYKLHIEKEEECMTKKELKELNMKSTKDRTIWVVEYTDYEYNTVLSVYNTQFQAAIDTTLSELKKMKLTE